MEWVSVKDRLPEEGENVILYDGNVVFCGDMQFYKQNEPSWGNQTCDGQCYGWYEKAVVTHWMPLPEPPKDENK